MKQSFFYIFVSVACGVVFFCSHIFAASKVEFCPLLDIYAAGYKCYSAGTRNYCFGPNNEGGTHQYFNGMVMSRDGQLVNCSSVNYEGLDICRRLVSYKQHGDNGGSTHTCKPSYIPIQLKTSCPRIPSTPHNSDWSCYLVGGLRFCFGNEKGGEVQYQEISRNDRGVFVVTVRRDGSRQYKTYSSEAEMFSLLPSYGDKLCTIDRKPTLPIVCKSISKPMGTDWTCHYAYGHSFCFGPNNEGGDFQLTHVSGSRAGPYGYGQAYLVARDGASSIYCNSQSNTPCIWTGNKKYGWLLEDCSQGVSHHFVPHPWNEIRGY